MSSMNLYCGEVNVLGYGKHRFAPKEIEPVFLEKLPASGKAGVRMVGSSPIYYKPFTPQIANPKPVAKSSVGFELPNMVRTSTGKYERPLFGSIGNYSLPVLKPAGQYGNSRPNYDLNSIKSNDGGGLELMFGKEKSHGMLEQMRKFSEERDAERALEEFNHRAQIEKLNEERNRNFAPADSEFLTRHLTDVGEFKPLEIHMRKDLGHGEPPSITAEPHINTSARIYDMKGIDAFANSDFHTIPLKKYKFIEAEE